MLNFRVPVFVLSFILFFSLGGAYAHPVNPWTPSSSNITSFRKNGHRIPSGSECEKILTEAQSRLGRELTTQEIEANLPAIFARTGEKLEYLPQPPRSGPRCFTANMKVATPTGERAMGTLRPGDEVVSIDLKTGKPVVNRIKFVLPARDRLVSRLVDLERPIDVTGRHCFLAKINDQPPAFMAIEDIPQSASLFRLNEECKLLPVQRGLYQPLPGTDTVFDLQLEGEPRNFIVEGILVHNVVVNC